MQISAFLLAMLFAIQVHAATPRCAKDDFGNVVCMDKDGVLGIASRAAEAGNAASDIRPDADTRDQKAPQRCAVDSFGNTVCSEHFKPKQEK